MNNMLEKFRGLSFNAKIAIVASILIATVLILFGVRIALIQIIPPTSKESSYSSPTPTPQVTSDDYDSSNSNMNGDPEGNKEMTPYFLNMAPKVEAIIDNASKSICNQNKTDSREDLIARMQPYFLNPEKHVDLIKTSNLSQSCKTNYGSSFYSGTESEKTGIWETVYVFEYMPAGEEAFPESERKTSKEYKTYRFSFQEQPDGSIKIIAIN